MITDMGPSAGQFMYNGQIPTMGMGMQITNIAPHHIQKAVSIPNSSYKITSDVLRHFVIAN